MRCSHRKKKGVRVGPRRHEESKPRPSRAPPRDAGAHRDKVLSCGYGYLRDRACVGLPGRAPSLVKRAHAYWLSR